MYKKIAYVNLVRVINESPVGNLEAIRNNQVKEVLANAEMAAQEAYLSMTEDAIQKNRAVDVENINQLWVIEQQNARAISLRVIFKEIEKYRILEGLDVILNSECVVSADKQYDVTDDIILNLKDVNVDYGDLPGFTVIKQEDVCDDEDGERNS